MKNISFDKNILYIGDKNIVFEDEIFQVKIEDDKIYVLLDIKPKEKLTYDDCNNVFCYSGKGRKIWQIGVRPKGNPTVYTMINFFMRMTLWEEDIILIKIQEKYKG